MKRSLFNVFLIMIMSMVCVKTSAAGLEGISAYNSGGAIMQTNDLINYGSKLNWSFSNNSNVNVTLVSMQLIDGVTKVEGNLMNVNELVGAGSTVSYTTTIGVFGIHVPVTCRFRYSYDGKEYYTDAVYKAFSDIKLTIRATGNGTVTYNGSSIRNGKESFSIDLLGDASISFTPDNGYRVKSVKINNSDVTSRLSNNQYRISMIMENTTVQVEFEAIPTNYNAKVKLSKTKAIIEKGKSLTLKATITPSDLPDKSVTWKSSNTKVATVTSSGKVKGVKAGTATITCTSNSTGAKATCKVTVGYVKLDQTEVTVKKGKTVTLNATVYPSTLEDKSVTWESSNKKVATVTSKGKVKGVKAGTATITCTSNATGLKTTCKVTVGYVKLDQTEVTVKKGKTVTLNATVYPSTLEDKSVTWESSNKKVATVTSKGKVKGIKAGSVVITCTSNATGLSTTCIVTVTATASTRSLEGDDNDEVTEIDKVEVSAAIEPFDVYDLSGRKVLHQVTSLDGLPDGIYIVNGKKILKKK